MTTEKANRVKELLELVNGIKDYKKFFSDREYGDIAHFELRLHHGDCSTSEIIKFETKINHRFIEVVENALKEYNDELDSL